jgi:hypothetical protein
LQSSSSRIAPDDSSDFVEPLGEMKPAFAQHLDTLSPKKFGGGGTEMSIVVDDDALQPLSS